MKRTTIRPRLAAVALASLCGFAVWSTAQAAAIGTFGFPSINGTVRVGDLAEAKRDLPKALYGQPLRIRISTASDPLEVAHIGVWLRQYRPILQVRDTCAGTCAMFMLGSARALIVEPGSVVAFSFIDEWPLVLKEHAEAGDLFVDDEKGRASRDRLLASTQPFLERARGVRGLRKDSGLPDWVVEFAGRLTSMRKATQVQFSSDDFQMYFKADCVFWVPDAEGLRQLGLEVPGYTPPTREQAAKALSQPAHAIYIGPALRGEAYQGGLCNAPGTGT